MERSSRAFCFCVYTGGVRFIRNYPALVLVCALALLCAVIWSAVYAIESRRSGVLTFAVLDIGQGDALFIEGPTGIQALVDAGPNTGAILRELPKVMPWRDRAIDAAIETHPDADHVGGFADVFERYQVSAFITPGVVKHNITTDTLEKVVSDERSLVYVARRGMVVDLGGGAYVKILYPDADVSAWGEHSNDGSVVAQLVYGSTTAMLMGDAPVSVEAHLLVAASSSLASDLLKAGHHGSRTSTSQEFLEAAHPKLALISVGANNKYGHPAREVLERLEKAGVPVMRTDREGTIICTSNAIRFSCKSED